MSSFLVALVTFVTSLSVLATVVTALTVLISIIAAYEILSRPARLQTANVDVNEQTEEVEPGVRRRRYVGGKKPPLGFEVPNTTYEVFTHGMKVSNDGDCLGWRQRDDSQQPSKLSETFTWLSYSKVRRRAHNFGAGLLDTGLVESAREPGSVENNACFVGIYAKNSVEWFVAAHACAAYRLVPVPLYDTLGPAAIAYVLKQVGMTTMIVDNEAAVEKLLKADAEGDGSMKTIVCITPVDSGSVVAEKCKTRGIELVTLEEMEQRGARSNRAPTPVRPDDLYMICYTSGTTGNPKGVMITHRAVTACLRHCLTGFLSFKVPKNQPVISYLPLAHTYEHLANLATLIHGCKIGIFSGNILNLADDAQVLHPTLMAVVPRILNRLYQKTMAGVQGSVVKKTLLRVALYFKVREIRQGYYRKNSIWDFLVFRRIQKALGGELSLLTVTSAPLARNVRDFTCAALGLPVLEGYGQTESTGAITFTLMQDDQPGQVGPPCDGVLIKLVDVPELDYIVARDGVGEVLIKSATVMKGYFRDEERTRETIDADGWLHTGDVGRWSDRGALQIVDRKKHLFKLAQGEYVAPEKVENVLQQCSAVAIIFVDGDPLETFTVAVVAPDVDYVKRWCSTQQQQPAGTTSIEDVNRHCTESKALRKQISEELAAYGKRNGLNSIEIPKRILLVTPDAFTVENGMLTPTMKLKRPNARKMYKKPLQELYAILDEKY